MGSFGKLLVILGAALMVAGVLVMVASRANIPIGRLPGDISYRGKNTAFFFPITTCIIISVVLSFILWLVNRFMR